MSYYRKNQINLNKSFYQLFITILIIILISGIISIALSQNQDCNTSKRICSGSLNDNSNGKGFIKDLKGSNHGCLTSNENQSAWYTVKISTSGTFNFIINPNTSTDDYDFAIWGPNSACPPSSNPIRCSYACHGTIIRCGVGGSTLQAQTGLTTTALDLSEGVNGDGYIKEMNVLAGEIYTILIDNYNAANNGFSISFGGTATIDCSGLPVELLYFKGEQINDKIVLNWMTLTEINLSYYSIEKYIDNSWKEILTENPRGNNTIYTSIDMIPNIGNNLYRLKSYDLDDKYQYYPNIINVNYEQEQQYPFQQQNNLIKIELKYDNNRHIIRIMNNSASTVFIKETTYSDIIDISYLSSGIYILYIDDRSYLFLKLK